MRIGIVVLLIFFSFNAIAQISFSIPPALLKNANIVFRYDDTKVEIKSLTKYTVTNRFAITILNERGDKYAQVTEYYDKFRKIDKFEGNLYDANGRKLKSLRKNDISDLSATSDISLAEDNRVMTHNFHHRTYPYTIEYETVVDVGYTMFLPSWTAVPASLVSSERSSFTVIAPADYTLRYKALNYPGDPVVTNGDGKKTYVWEIKNFEAIKMEYASPAFSKLVPSVRLAPSEFQIENYKGNLTNWTEFGNFISTLNKGRDVLPPELKQKVKELTASLTTDEEKIDALYKYMQKNTRYISIQLGIGGWRPFDASYVSNKGYGDCKALSNFMYSLLQEAGIGSHYTLITAGSDKEDLDIDFPASQFNHAILCVPNKGDTIWLECTSQTVATGYMGRFTGNRHALLITEKGGVVAKTPTYGIKENLQKRNIKAKVLEDGSVEMTAQTYFTGMQQDDLHMVVNQLSKEKIKELYLESGLNLGTYEIVNFEYKEAKKELPEMTESLTLLINNYATVSGKRLFIVPNILSRFTHKLTLDEERKFEIRLPYAYTDSDIVEIEVAEGYTAESIPADVNIKTPFGEFTSSVSFKDNKIIYNRTLVHNAGTFPKTDYPALVSFYEALTKADKARVVLVKN